MLTNLEGSVSDFEWSPDGAAIVLVSCDPDQTPDSTPDSNPDSKEDNSETKPPIVITRLQFKRDRRGYLDDRRTHLYVVDVS